MDSFHATGFNPLLLLFNVIPKCIHIWPVEAPLSWYLCYFYMPSSFLLSGTLFGLFFPASAISPRSLDSI